MKKKVLFALCAIAFGAGVGLVNYVIKDINDYYDIED